MDSDCAMKCNEVRWSSPDCMLYSYVPKGVDKDLLHQTCGTLRVLNQLRAPRVGMPLTWAQYHR
jgi:hypothetical protein